MEATIVAWLKFALNGCLTQWMLKGETDNSPHTFPSYATNKLFCKVQCKGWSCPLFCQRKKYGTDLVWANILQVTLHLSHSGFSYPKSKVTHQRSHRLLVVKPWFRTQKPGSRPQALNHKCPLATVNPWEVQDAGIQCGSPSIHWNQMSGYSIELHPSIHYDKVDHTILNPLVFSSAY
jgi:hypothetical protein